MKEVPNIISTKDLDYLKDMFQWNFVASKEIDHFKEEVKSEDIKELLSDIAKMHMVHCKCLLSILQGDNYE